MANPPLPNCLWCAEPGKGAVVSAQKYLIRYLGVKVNCLRIVKRSYFALLPAKGCCWLKWAYFARVAVEVVNGKSRCSQPFERKPELKSCLKEPEQRGGAIIRYA